MSMSNTPNPKREAKQLLGLVDENFRSIEANDLSREALLISLEMQKIRIENQNIAHAAQRDNLLAIIKSAKQAKALANKRADDAEAALKQVRSALGDIDTLTQHIQP